MLEVIHRISRSVAVPVTADIEAGYGASVAELEDTIRGLVDTGAVGMNIEDSLEEGGPLRPADEQAERIATVREAAAARGLDLVINARVDTFLSDRFDQVEERIEEAVARAEAYRRAGADCIYPIGPGDVEDGSRTAWQVSRMRRCGTAGSRFRPVCGTRVCCPTRSGWWFRFTPSRPKN